MKKYDSLIIAFIVLVMSLVIIGCQADEDLFCNCTKKTYDTSSAGAITSTKVSIACEDYGDIDGYGGVDENGNTFVVECKK